MVGVPAQMLVNGKGPVASIAKRRLEICFGNGIPGVILLNDLKTENARQVALSQR